MQSFDNVLHSTGSADADPGEISAANLTLIRTELVLLDDSALPPPVSSLQHVARSTAGRGSLVPRKPPWPFNLPAHPHRTAS